jgi:hypothetical protein
VVAESLITTVSSAPRILYAKGKYKAYASGIPTVGTTWGAPSVARLVEQSGT